MNAFSFPGLGTINFGVGCVENLGDDVRSLVKRDGPVVLISDAGVAGAGIVDRIKSILDRCELDVIEFTGIKGEPLAEDVEAATAIVRRCDPACVIGLGGGSALDVTKIAAVIADGDRPVEDYALCAHPFPRPRHKRIMIPTTAGTGSEATRTAVFTTHDHRKVWAWGYELAAEHVVLDPSLTVSLPAQVTAATGLDAIVHAIEACTSRQRNHFIDSFGLQAIRLGTRHLMEAIKDPQDLTARSGMLLASNLAGIAFANTGTAAAHSIGHALATLGGIPHGRAVAIGLDTILEWNTEASPEAFGAVAQALGGSNDAKDAALRFRSLIEQTGLKRSLADSGIDPQTLAEVMLAPENKPMLENDARTITSDDALELARRTLSA